MPMSIFPPILASTQPAFLYTTTSYIVYFTLQNITSFEDIGHVQVRVVRQSNNRTIVNTSRYPDGTIYKLPSALRTEGKRYGIAIQLSDLAEPWQPGYVYKVQMRFGTTGLWGGNSNFATWKQEQINNQTFSEWSTVMVIKVIGSPTVTIKNAETKKQDVISSRNIEPTTTPLFVGSYTIQDVNKEAEDKYKFDLYRGEDILPANLIESSGWLQHNEAQNATDQHRFKYRLLPSETYTLVYTIVTMNGYEQEADPYIFEVVETYYPGLEDSTLRAEDSTVYCQENGCIQLYFTSPTEINGTLVVTRTDEYSNFEVWEDLKYIVVHRSTFDNTLLFTDFTIESGIKYRYAIQQENSVGLRTNPKTEGGDKWRMVDFEYSYFYADDIQLRVSLNQKLSSFKHTVLASKQDTLGDRYPHILKNGYAYYAEFPITGTISLHMDPDETFVQLDSAGYHYKEDTIVQPPRFPDKQKKRQSDNSTLDMENYESIGVNLTGENFFRERKFREKVEAFLNNYKYKLYRSPSEGNIVVILMNVSMTPNATLGRMIFDFSATAYEVAELTIKNLDEYGIIDIGEFSGTTSDEVETVFGQLSDVYTTGSEVDIFAKVKQQEEKYYEGYKLQVTRVKAIWIDRYPQTKMTAELAALEAQRAQALLNDEPTAEIDAEIKRLTDTVNAIQNNAPGLITLSINGTDIRVLPNRIYTLSETVNNITVVDSAYPILINYVAELIEVEDTTVGVISSVETSRIWGQLAGIFTDNESVLKTYNSTTFDTLTRPYRIYNPSPDNTVKRDKLGRVIVDNTHYNAYKSENLLDIIQEETRMQVENIYNIEGGFYQDEDGQWTDGTIYYTFQNIIEFDIEADAGTVLWIGSSDDGSDKHKITIGPTQRYTLNPMENMVRYIALDSGRPQFCIINYKCLTTQMTMAGGELYARLSK